MMGEQASGEVPSPCVNVCQMHPEKNYCVGCLRTMDEITDWLDMRNEEKFEVLARVERRKKAVA